MRLQVRALVQYGLDGEDHRRSPRQTARCDSLCTDSSRDLLLILNA